MMCKVKRTLVAKETFVKGTQQYFRHFNTWDFHYIIYAGMVDENGKYVGMLETVEGIRLFLELSRKEKRVFRELPERENSGNEQKDSSLHRERQIKNRQLFLINESSLFLFILFL